MMKKLISLVLCAVLLLSCWTFAQAENPQKGNVAVDIVLLIDQSGSVWYDANNSKPSDPNGNRLDAAQIVIGLLGMNGSRVAYVPFAARVFENADSSFHTISGPEDYHAKMAECEKLREEREGRNGENRGGTDFAEALAYAYNLLAQRGSNETNQPMIILLTDGSLNLELDNQNYLRKDYYTWNSGLGVFTKTPNQVNVYATRSAYRNATYVAEELLEDAVKACVRKEYPVYTVALAADAKSEHYAELNDISTRTGGGSAIAIGKNDNSALEQLPAYFGKMFADRIGSSELRTLTAKPVAGQANTYEVEFVIPNDSVMEANLFVSKKGIGALELYNAENKRPGTSTVTELSSKNFVLYKLNNPTPYGIWRLRFTKTDDSMGDISFNLLYNYNVVLHGFVGEQYGYEQYSEGQTFSRGDTLTFSARFWDNRKGAYSEDPTLYDYPLDASSTADDWCEMNATYKLYRVVDGVNVSTVSEGEMGVAQSTTAFEVTLDMKKLKENNGFNALPAGNYVMDINVEGCGLVRKTSVPFALENTLPSNNVSNIVKAQYVDVVEGDGVENYSLADYISDFDNDRLISSFTQISGQEYVALTYNPDTTTLTSTAVADEEGKHHSGSAEGQLKVKETDTGLEKVIPVVVNIVSGNEELFNLWDLKATANGAEDGVVVDKNTDVEIKLELILRESGVLDHSNKVDEVEAEIRIENDATRESVSAKKMTMGDDKVFVYKHTTGVKEGSWTVSVELKQKDTGLTVNSKTTSFKVENHAPVAVSTVEGETEKLTIYHNALPEFLAFLGTVTPEEDRTLDMSDFFSEGDNENLVYQLVDAPDAMLFAVKREGDEDPTWVLTTAEGVSYKAKDSFRVYARDNDNAASGEIVFEIELVNLIDLWIHRGLLALAALIALVILLRIIHQIRKPKFPQAVLGVREGSSDYDTSTYELLPSKKPITLASVVMTDTAAKFGINANALTNIILVPVRSMNGSIGVRLNKKMDDVTVSLTTKGVGKGKKPAIWAPGDSLVLNGRANTTGTELNVLLFPPETAVSGGAVVEEGPFNLADDGGFGGFNGNVNAFGANDVSGSFGGFAATDSFGANSFSNDNGFGSASNEDDNVSGGFSSDDDSNNGFAGF